MKYAVIRDYRAVHAVGLMCRVLRVSRSGFYAWCQRRPSARARTDQRLRVEIRAIYRANDRRYGSPRILRELRPHYHCSRKRVARLMREDGLRARRARRYRCTTQADPQLAPAPNVLQRRFAVPQPNRVWVGDVTACPTRAGWLYLATLLDLASRRVVGWAAGPTVGQELTLAALHQALAARRPAPGLLHHSDRGMHYTGAAYRQRLARHGITVSMSRRGDCWDNAVAESFFATLKTELLEDRIWETQTEGQLALRSYLNWYNRQRLHSSLGYRSPVDFERRLTAA